MASRDNKTFIAIGKSINPDAVHFLTGDFTLALYICLNNKRTFYYTVHDLHPHEVVRKTLLGYLMQNILYGDINYVGI